MKFSHYFLFILVSIFMFSCSEIFEEELKSEKVKLLSPGESSTEYIQVFWWAKVEGATNYNFQMVEGDFDQPVKFLTDTNLVLEKLTLTLNPGIYQWRVKAFNGAYETSYSVRNLKIDSTALEQQKVNIQIPLSETFYSSLISFSWDHLFGATSYILEVESLIGNFSNPIFRDTILAGSSTDFTIIRDIKAVAGNYQWRVKAENSMFSNIGKFTINPAAPEISTPLHGAANLTAPISLTWNADAGIQSYTVIVQDSIRNQIKKESSIIQKTFSFDPGSIANKKFYWAVFGKDLSGISSDTSSFQLFGVK
jgi:hypothetical protein